MKHIVIFDEYNDTDFKPSELLHTYIELTKKDVQTFLIQEYTLKKCACPGCQKTKIRSSFEKSGLRYAECNHCNTLYISPRPDDDALRRYYKESKARRFWQEELSKLTQKKRREKIIKPRFEWIVDSTREYLPEATHIDDVNANQAGYIEELIQTDFFTRKTIFNPLLSSDTFSDDTIRVVNAPSNETSLDGEADVVTLFEVADRTSNVDGLFNKTRRMLRKNGLCFMTDILISGFDLQTLWKGAENISPPDRLNVFSVEGLKALFERHDFECIEFSTPGMLDVQIVESAMRNDHKLKLPRFTRYLLKNKDEAAKISFQQFLQRNLLSSYGRILIRKK